MTTARQRRAETEEAGQGVAPVAAEALRHVRSLLLLGGSLRHSDLTSAVQLSLLDLPVEPGLSILGHWCQHARALLAAAGLAGLPIRLLLTQSSSVPQLPAERDGCRVTAETDPFEFRGTGGVLRDTTRGYGPDEYVLVANAAQVLLEPLPRTAQAAADLGADVCVVVHADGSPSGLMLIRCGCLESVAEVGFVDMKEQALPRLATNHHVAVLRCDEPTGLPVRTRSDYIAALQRYYRRERDTNAPLGPFAEDWKPTFALAAEGATVSAGAHLHDSVVLGGAQVGTGAVLVRSVVGPGAVVEQDAMVVDQVVQGRK